MRSFRLFLFFLLSFFLFLFLSMERNQKLSRLWTIVIFKAMIFKGVLSWMLLRFFLFFSFCLLAFNDIKYFLKSWFAVGISDSNMYRHDGFSLHFITRVREIFKFFPPTELIAINWLATFLFVIYFLFFFLRSIVKNRIFRNVIKVIGKCERRRFVVDTNLFPFIRDKKIL